MPQLLKIASAQSRTLSTTAETLHALEQTTKRAATQGVDILLFPEAYLGGYPRTCDFGSVVGSRTPQGRDQFLHYFHAAVDLGDTPSGAGNAWVDRQLELPPGKKHRGDGTREELERIARETGVFVVTGLVERCAGTLYCGAVFVCPRRGALGKRRKVMPTGAERVVWGQGAAASLRAVTAEIRGVRLCMGAAICWENYMPLLRQSLYAQNVNLWFAPTADARGTWEALMRTVGVEGRCVVVSANQCVRRRQLPGWITGGGAAAATTTTTMHVEHGHGHGHGHGQRRRRSTITLTEDKHEICWPIVEEDASNTNADGLQQKNGDMSAIEDDSASVSPTGLHATKVHSHVPPRRLSVESASHSVPNGDEFVSRGGSCIVSPFGDVLAGPLWEVEGELLVCEVDFEDCERGRLDLDVAGSYSRSDAFKLTVEGLDLNPPP